MKATIKLEDGRTLDVTINDEQLNQFEKQEPMTWEKLGKVSGHYINGSSDIFNGNDFTTHFLHRNIYPTKEHAEAALAEAQLLQLRNWYRDGWKPALKDDCWYVYKSMGGLHILRTEFSGHQVDLFSFQSEEIAERFLNEQRELLEVWAKKFSA